MAQITHNQMAKLFRRLATGYGAGIDLKSVYTRETETGNAAYRKEAKGIVDELGRGKTLAESMQATPGYFPDLAVSVVNAGERGGRLEEAFDRLSNHFESLVKFRNGFLLSIAWPLFELVFAIVLIGVVILLLGLLAGDEAANWFGMGSAFANFLFYSGCVLGIATVIALAFLGLKYGWFGTLPMRIARNIPIVGKTIEALALSRFAWTMSISENAGMNAMDIARMSLQSTQNFFYQRLVEPVCKSLQRGSEFSTAFRASKAFPEDFLIYVENGETAGELAESMDRASKDYQSRAENNLKLLGTIGFVLTFIFVAAVIGTVIIMMAKKFYIDPLNDMLNF